ncbi:MAG: DJ-1/PfpI family protein [Candidatus Methanomethylicaceae archaeon]
MAKILFVVAEKGFRDEEYYIPREIIENAGHRVTLASTGKGPAHGKLGLVMRPDMIVDDVNPQEYDGIVIPGGPGSPTYLWNNQKLQSLAKEILHRGGVVAAICLAPVVLARAGLLQGRKCTVYPTPESLSEMRRGGGILQDLDVVVDGRIITANGPEASRRFGEAIVKALEQIV